MQIQTIEKHVVQNPAAFRESEIREMLAEAIDALPKMERLVLSLYCYEEFTLKEIGSILGIDEHGVSQLKTKAMLKLQPLCRLIEAVAGRTC
jgi:RNA polymerase sigma factor FliA